MDIKLTLKQGEYGGTLVIGDYKLKAFKEEKDSEGKKLYHYTHPFAYYANVSLPSDFEEKLAIKNFILSNKKKIEEEYGLVFEIKGEGKAWLKYAYPKECEVLGIDTYVTRDEVVSIYRQLSLQFHPDRLPNATDEKRKEAEEKFKTISAAYKTLMSFDFDSSFMSLFVTDLNEKRKYFLWKSVLEEEKEKRISSLHF